MIKHDIPAHELVRYACAHARHITQQARHYNTAQPHQILIVSASAQPPAHMRQMLTRISDIPAEPLCLLIPIVGIKDAARHPILHAAIVTGVEDMDAFGWVAGEHGSALARNDPHGLDTDEVAAIALYTTESKVFSLNGYLRKPVAIFSVSRTSP